MVARSRRRHDRRRLPRRRGLPAERRRPRLGQPAQPHRLAVPRQVDRATATRASGSSTRRPTSVDGQTASPASGSRTASTSPGPRTAASPRREFAEKFDHYRDGGFLPVDIDVYRTASGGAALRRRLGRRTADGARVEAAPQPTSAQYAARFKTYADQGLRSLVVDSARTAGGQRYAGIWIENRSAARLVRLPRHHRDRLPQPLEPLADMGYRLDGYEKYDTAVGRALRRHLAPELRPAELEAALEGRRASSRRSSTTSTCPASASRHRPTARSSTGAASATRTRPTASGCTAARSTALASVSKAVAGVLALRMDAKHSEFSLDDKVRDAPAVLPAKHDYTMAQAVMNRSCVDAATPTPMTSQNADALRHVRSTRSRRSWTTAAGLHAGLTTSTARTPTRSTARSTSARGQVRSTGSCSTS